MPAATIAALHALRAAETEQALFYEALASAAAAAGDGATSDRLKRFHADEQDHLSRLTARLIQIGEPVEEVGAPPVLAALEGWRAEARRRESEEAARYESVLEHGLDVDTEALLREILWGEWQHERALAGPWSDSLPSDRHAS